MAEFLTTSNTSSCIENIIMNAQQRMVLVSPYLRLSKTIFERLKDADTRGTKIVLVYGKDELEPEVKAQLRNLKNLDLFFCENLHAKCYFNEQHMVITSMNLHQFSEKNNREMGILIKIPDDSQIYREAVQEVQSIVRASNREYARPNIVPSQNDRSRSIPGRKTSSPAPTTNRSLTDVLKDALSTAIFGEKLDGYCIRCGERIPKNPMYPLCDECYPEWAVYKNASFTERFCHVCGTGYKTSKNKPMCRSCFSAESR
jgi:hypothetical protein